MWGVGRKVAQRALTSQALERRISQLAARQHGNVTHPQLLELGLSRGAIKRRTSNGRLHPIHRGVYGLGRPAKTARERASAALLACGDDALLSHASALALWDLRDWPYGIEVTVPRDRRPPGIIVHRCCTLLPRDVRRRQGLRVTSPARTLLDCAPHLTPRALTRAVNDALRVGILRRGALIELLNRCPTHPGAARLAPLAAEQGNPTRSGFEDDFLAFCVRFGLPRPLLNTIVAGHEVDAFFPHERVIVECDGWSFHRERDAFERDRDRDADALAQGIVTVRITWERLHHRAQAEAQRLAAILTARKRDAA